MTTWIQLIPFIILSDNKYTIKNTLKVSEEDLRSLMFGDYMNPDVEPEDRVYSEIKDIDAFYSVAESQLEEYNNIHKTRMNLVIFRLVGLCTMYTILSIVIGPYYVNCIGLDGVCYILCIFLKYKLNYLVFYNYIF